MVDEERWGAFPPDIRSDVGRDQVLVHEAVLAVMMRGTDEHSARYHGHPFSVFGHQHIQQRGAYLHSIGNRDVRIYRGFKRHDPTRMVRMNKVIGLLFTFVYVIVAFFLGVLGSVHGASLFPYFELSFLVMALSVLWWLCFFIPPRMPKHASTTLTLCGVGLGSLLVLGSFGSQGPLIDWDVRQMQKHAAATEVLNMRDEILPWQESTPIGIRLSYSLRFPDSNYYWQSPFLSPETRPWLHGGLEHRPGDYRAADANRHRWC